MRGLRRALGVALLALVAACTMSGRAFDSAGLRHFVAGETTLAQATRWLQAAPVAVYRDADGSRTARWAIQASYVPDALYFHQELWLAFDRDGHFSHVVNSLNVPPAYALPQVP